MSGKVIDFELKVKCDFCKSTQDQVLFLVASPDHMTHVCNECIAQMALMLRKWTDKAKEGAE